MNYHLIKKLNIPLEREYEGWLSSQIENYFSNIGVNCEVFAISPQDENIFPSDINYFFRGKLIGLQLKRPNENLQFEIKKEQHNKIVDGKLPIYYALPTFFNSELKKNSIEHFVFYRPEPVAFGKYKSKWIKYLNNFYSDKILIEKAEIEVCRWGKFVELIFECKVGKLLTLGQNSIRGIKFSKSLKNEYSPIVKNHLNCNKNIFSLSDNPLIENENVIDAYKEYFSLLKNGDKNGDDILFLVFIKS
jgi:hypothetical protein